MSSSSSSQPKQQQQQQQEYDDNDDDVVDNLNPVVIEKLQAGAFRSLLHHLQERSDVVSNIDLMTLSGFCRNCLAKWMVLEARRMVDSKNPIVENDDGNLMNQLNSWTYDDAAKIVYGTSYEEWKQRYQTKATAEQMEKYNASLPIHSLFDKGLLKPREPIITKREEEQQQQKQQQQQLSSDTNNPTAQKTISNNNNNNETTKPAILSNVCCENVDTVAATTPSTTTTTTTIVSPIRNDTQQQVHSSLSKYPLPPSIDDIITDRPQLLLNKQPLCVGIVTISDRAYRGEYPRGDQSGPALQQSIHTIRTAGNNNNNVNNNSMLPAITYVTRLVPDDRMAIQNAIQELTQDDNKCDIIVTTGGTGVSTRDVTPEAIRSIETFIEYTGLMNYISNVTAQYEPYCVLSRGIAGIVSNSTFIATLPGNPKAVQEIIPYLFPLALSAIADLRG